MAYIYKIINSINQKIYIGIKSHIGDCAKGKRKTAYKHKWEFI